jgi:pyocin large subunit-like protein
MSLDAVKWASKVYDVSAREKAILMCLADRHNPLKGYAWPSHASISRDTSFSVSTVKRAIKGLEVKGLVISARQIEKFEKKPASNRYYLVGHSPSLPQEGRVFVVDQYFNENGQWTIEDYLT